MRRLLAPASLGLVLLATAACTYPNGEVDWSRTALLGAGVLAAGAVIAAATDDDDGYRRCRGGCGRGRGHGYGPAYPGGSYGYAPRYAPAPAYPPQRHAYRGW